MARREDTARRSVKIVSFLVSALAMTLLMSFAVAVFIHLVLRWLSIFGKGGP